MEVSKAKKAIEMAHEQINGLTDVAFKGRKLNVLRTLDLASKALERAAAHLDTAKTQDEKKDAPVTEGATAVAGAQA